MTDSVLPQPGFFDSLGWVGVLNGKAIFGEYSGPKGGCLP